MSDPDSPFRHLPAIHVLLARPEFQSLTETLGPRRVLEAVRAAVDDARRAIVAGVPFDLDEPNLAALAVRKLAPAPAFLREVLNGTDLLLNTGLGRAPLATEAVEAITRVARGYSNLEWDLDRGERGRRTTGVSALLRELTGAEAAAVVNNNAAATILALKALAQGREVVVSRGQLVEIGGSFRLPEIFEVSGAILREVGTTNKTRLDDYRRAIGPQTAALLRVHPSNYRVVGFTESVGIAELSQLAHEHGLHAIDDIGSGALEADSLPIALGDEPTARGSLAAGADLVLFSGDKLLGGPQAGILAGRHDLIRKIEQDPLMRALRVDKLTLAALEATLLLQRDPALADRRVPLRALLAASLESLQSRAIRLADRLSGEGFWKAEAVETLARVGGGSLPVETIASWGVRLAPAADRETNLDQLSRALRLGDPSVVAYVREDAIVVDLRAIFESDDDRLAVAIERVGRGFGNPARVDD